MTENRLGTELSPYLRQHRTNPVDWYPWGQQAIDKAREENKMIFLSIGYSTCHWCHVMERESFESEQVAEVMNRHFVNVKVDREERPDVDKVYMTFVQATTGGGGWPLSLFLTPSLLPVYGGTYFPPVGNFGRPSFTQVLTALSRQWGEEDNKEDMEEAGRQVLAIMDKQLGAGGMVPSDRLPGDNILNKFFTQLSHSYDPEFGGYSKAPKFPQPSNLMTMFRLQTWSEHSGDRQKRGLEMNLHTLRMMAKGGIHDHVSQGFARYSTDKEWHVPHFEKMLYDQAQLVTAYTTAALLTKDPLFPLVVKDIITYVTRDLAHPQGCFFSAEDADSLPLGEEEGGAKKEGAFCVWDYQELRDLLDRPVAGEVVSLADVAIIHYNVKEGGNVDPRGDPHGELKGKNVLTELPEKDPLIEMEKHTAALEEARKLMFTERLKRPRPGLDDKILCSWNGLMISALARAGSCFVRPEWVEMAVSAADFVLDRMYDKQDKVLLRSCYGAGAGSGELKQLETPIQGFVDDYCFMVSACLELHQVTLASRWLEMARELQDKQDLLFLDTDKGGYFASREGDPQIVLRLKDDQDGAEPSSNSVSAMNLLILARLLGNQGTRYQGQAEQIFKLFSTRLEKMPVAMPALVEAYLFHAACPVSQVLLLTGDLATHHLLAELRGEYLPNLPLLHCSQEGGLVRDCHPMSQDLDLGVDGAFLARAGCVSENISSVEQLRRLLRE